MTALFSPALRVLTVMIILPRRRRSARVIKNLPRMPAATVERRCTNHLHHRGWVMANNSIMSFLPPFSNQKAKRTPHQVTTESPYRQARRDEIGKLNLPHSHPRRSGRALKPPTEREDPYGSRPELRVRAGKPVPREASAEGERMMGLTVDLKLWHGGD